MALTAKEIDEAVVSNLEQRADLLSQRLVSTDDGERAFLLSQIQATHVRADELATLQGVLSVVTTLRNPTKPPVDTDLVSNLQERATLLEQSAAAADKPTRDQLQAQISLNAAKADDLAKLRSIQDTLAKQAADAEVAADAADVAEAQP